MMADLVSFLAELTDEVRLPSKRVKESRKNRRRQKSLWLDHTQSETLGGTTQTRILTNTMFARR